MSTTTGQSALIFDRSACAARRHGDVNAYHSRCRCPDAREDKRIYDKRLRERRAIPRRVDSTATIRKVEALQAMGWRLVDIGVTRRQSLRELRSAKFVLRSTADRIDAVYDRLSMTVGPSAQVRGRAASRGYAPPLAWDDDTIGDPNAEPTYDGPADPELADPGLVDPLASRRAAARREMDRRKAERQAEIAELTAKKMSASEISRTLRITTRTVERYRRAIRTAASADLVAA